MTNGEGTDVRRQPLDTIRDSIRRGYRYRLSHGLPHNVTRQIQLEEAWNDMARAAQGKRVLQRLNSGYRGTLPNNRGYSGVFHTFGGLKPSGPPKFGTRQPIKGPGIGNVFRSDYMKRIRRYAPPSLPGYRPRIPGQFPYTRTGTRKVPTGRINPFPREVNGMPFGARQGWLRNYYRANPVAAQQARREARTVINWAHRHLR